MSGHPHPPIRVHELHRPSVADGISGAQDGISVDECLRGTFQRRHVEVTADQTGISDGVGGATGREVVEEPQ